MTDIATTVIAVQWNFLIYIVTRANLKYLELKDVLIYISEVC